MLAAAHHFNISRKTVENDGFLGAEMAYFLSTLLWGVRVALGLARVWPLIELFF